MKNTLLFLLMILSNENFGQELKVMTYNIRLDIASDGENKNTWNL